MAKEQQITVQDIILRIYFKYPRRGKSIDSLVAILKSALQQPWKWRNDIAVDPQEIQEITFSLTANDKVNSGFTFHN